MHLVLLIECRRLLSKTIIKETIKCDNRAHTVVLSSSATAIIALSKLHRCPGYWQTDPTTTYFIPN